MPRFVVRRLFPLVALSFLVAAGGLARAAEPLFRPAILFESEILFDNGFTESAYRGALAFTEVKGTKVTSFAPVVRNPDGSVNHVRIVGRALDGNHSPVVGVGYGFTDAFAEIAPRNPDTKFILIDSELPGPNIQSILFREEQGSFLVGAMAALASKTGIIGFVGGQDMPLIRNFGCGYFQGAYRAKPRTRILSAMVGTTVEAFFDPKPGKRVARRMIEAGADVIYHAAGLSGNGVIEAAAESGVLAIGVDSNQNSMAPGHVLTSMLKRLDVAIYLSFLDISEGRWRPGTLRLGLTEGAIGWALDEHNIHLVNQDMQDHVDNQAFEIMADRIRVGTYDEGQGCQSFDPIDVEDWGVAGD